MAEMNTRKRGNKWEYYFEVAQIEGKRKRISKGGFRTKADAVTAGHKAMSEYLTAGSVNPTLNISVHDFLLYWLEQYCEPNLKSTTVLNYKKRIKQHIDPVIGKYTLSAIQPEQLQRLINSMVSKGYSKNTILTVKGILSNSFGYAVNPLKYLASSPMLYVKLPKGSRQNYKQTQRVRNAIPDDVIEQIFERFPEGSSCYLPMQFAYRCGMRLGEAFAVTWDNIDFSYKTITIDKQLQWDSERSVWYITPPKYNSIRKIDIDQTMMDLLLRTKIKQDQMKLGYAEYYETIYYDPERGINTTVGEPIEFVNTRDSGGYIQPRVMQHTSSIIHKFYPAFDFHSLRHTHCTKLLEAGLPIKYVQERLGHKNITVTMEIYNHLTQNQAEQSKQALDNIFNNKKDST